MTEGVTDHPLLPRIRRDQVADGYGRQRGREELLNRRHQTSEAVHLVKVTAPAC